VNADGGGAADINLGDTITLDGVTYEFNVSGTTTSNVLVEVALADDELAIDGVLATAINAQHALGNTTLSAVDNTDGTIDLTNNLVGAAGISYAESMSFDAGAAVTLGAVTDGTDATADADGVTSRGTITLSASENFTLGGADLAFAGMASANPALTQLGTVDISTVSGANSAIAVLDGALAQISSNRADLGAVQNRFESTMANLSTASENLSSARSRILDADFAAETANLTRAQILQQAGVAMVSQANALPQSVLSLLQ
jgi:flagellin